jgi:hypothetical protein
MAQQWSTKQSDDSIVKLISLPEILLTVNGVRYSTTFVVRLSDLLGPRRSREVILGNQQVTLLSDPW